MTFKEEIFLHFSQFTLIDSFLFSVFIYILILLLYGMYYTYKIHSDPEWKQRKEDYLNGNEKSLKYGMRYGKNGNEIVKSLKVHDLPKFMPFDKFYRYSIGYIIAFFIILIFI